MSDEFYCDEPKTKSSMVSLQLIYSTLLGYSTVLHVYVQICTFI